MRDAERFLIEHRALTRRYFIRMGLASAAASGFWSWTTGAAPPVVASGTPPTPDPELTRAIEEIEPYFTAQEKFRDVSRGKPLPHSLSEEKKRRAGMTRETWRLEIVSDPESPA